MKIQSNAVFWFFGSVLAVRWQKGKAKPNGLPLEAFHEIHASEAHLHFSGENGGRPAESGGDPFRRWQAALDHEWERLLGAERKAKRQLEGSTEPKESPSLSGGGPSPFMVCDMEEGKAGIDALQWIMNLFQQPKDVIASINQYSRTCFVVVALPSLAQAANHVLDSLVVTPFMDVMKMESGLLDTLSTSEASPYGLSGVLCQRHSQDEGFDLLEGILSGPWTQTDRSLLQREHAFHPESRSFWRRHLETSSPESCYEIFEAVTPETSRDGRYFSFNLPTRMSDSEEKRRCLQTLAAMVASDPAICRVEAMVPFQVLNEDARWISQSNMDDFTPFFEVGINGTGQIAQISDSGLDQGHCSFVDEDNGFVSPRPFFHVEENRRKVIQYINYRDSLDYDSGHGTHVVGSALGYQTGGGVADGAAPGARVAFFDAGDVDQDRLIFTPPDLIGDFHSLGYDAGARIHSASWGGSGNDLDSRTAMHDQFMYDNDDYLFIVAAGNSGPGFGTVGSPATTKNGVAVGAAGNNIDREEVVDFSGRGPTRDGRIKPEVVATGRSVISAAANIAGGCETLLLSGTSMATPITSGTALQIRQYFQEGYYPGGYKESSSLHSNPSGALVKAILMIGAREMLTAEGFSASDPSSYHDDIQGWGSILLLNSLPLAGYNSFKSRVHDRVPIVQGEHHSYWVKIDTNGGACEQDLRVMMVYTDAPNTMGCTTDCVLNDVDMYVFGTNSPIYPNGKTTRDTKNVAERVIVENPVDGELYEIKVEGRDLVSPSQNYALVINGCLAPDDDFQPGTSFPTKAPVTFAPTITEFSISTDKTTYAVGEHITIEYQHNGPILDPEDFVGVSFEDYGTLEALVMFRFTCGSSFDACNNEIVTTDEFELFEDGQWPLPPGTYHITLNGQAFVDVIYARTTITVVDEMQPVAPSSSRSPSFRPSATPTMTPTADTPQPTFTASTAPTTSAAPSTGSPTSTITHSPVSCTPTKPLTPTPTTKAPIYEGPPTTSTAAPTSQPTELPSMSPTLTTNQPSAPPVPSVPPSASPVSAVEASVVTDGTVYDFGESLDVIFEVIPAQMGDWIGIFPAAQAPDLGYSRTNASLWVHTCGTQEVCMDSLPMSGVVRFGPGESGWPLGTGDYVAALLRADNTEITFSAPFSVLEDSMMCEDDEDATFVVAWWPRDCRWLRQKYAERVLGRDYCEDEDVRSACPYTCGECLASCQDDPDYTFQTPTGESCSCARIWEEHPDYIDPFCGGEYDPEGNNIINCPRACMACAEGG